MSKGLGVRIFATLVGVALLAASFLFGYGVGNRSSDANPYDLLAEVEGHILSSALSDIGEAELFRGALQGMVRALGDPYSEYLEPDRFQLLQDSLESHFSGVGIAIKQEGELHEVVSVLPDTPAADSGILLGDIIVSVDGLSVGGLTVSEVASLIKGETDSQVRITILRNDEMLDFKLTRKEIDRESVRSELLEDGIGLLVVASFTNDVSDIVREAVKDLLSRGATGFILDLRGNTGGDFNQGIEVTSIFVDGGAILSYQERGKAEVVFEASSPAETELPLVVLVDEGSASSSEIVAGAVQDRGRGIIVGTETFGKNSIQSVIRLSNGSALRLTTADWRTPSGHSIGDDGIKPDVVVANKEAQLARARQILLGNVAARTGPP